jgi:uroporphyrin-III C-methyltransferase
LESALSFSFVSYLNFLDTTVKMASALLTAVDCSNQIHLVVGSNPLASSRCSKSIQVGAQVLLIAPETSSLHYSLQKRVEDGEVKWIKSSFNDQHLTTLGRQEFDNVVDAVFVTLPAKDPLRTHISSLCRRLRIPINVSDSVTLSSFTLLATHSDGPLHIGITTSGKGCKLATRIKREIAASLPAHLGDAVSRLGTLRKKLLEEDNRYLHSMEDDIDGEDEDSGQTSSFNQLIKPEDVVAARDRRMRWIAQICEYWPLKRLAAITDEDVSAVLDSYRSPQLPTQSDNMEPSSSELDQRLSTRKKGRIILAGSGPGSPELLTIATLEAIKSADIILADKLVPAPVLDLIPRRTPVHIARKFPGNAEAAQEELLNLGLQALLKNQVVLRLKQGDPYLYGRGGEEVLWFRERGYECLVLPGVTSALSAPLFANVPVTMRDVSDQVVICTGTGRKGVVPVMPEYVATRTLVVLMGLHRLEELVKRLTKGVDGEQNDPKRMWPIETPCSIIERASCRDQRVIRATLEHVCAAVEELGSRPPGLIVIGKACAALGSLDGKRWAVEDGFAGLNDIGMLGGDLGFTGLLSS